MKMMFVNYYSRIRNTLHGDYNEMIARDKGRIITKEVEVSNWSINAMYIYRKRAGILARKIAEFNNRYDDNFAAILGFKELL